MSTFNEPLKGIIRGNSILLDTHPHLPDGQTVWVTVSDTPAAASHDRTQALMRAFGAWRDESADVDAFLAESRSSRHITRPEIEE